MALSDKASYVTACWSLDESSGSRVDSVASLTLTDNNTVGSTTGKLGTAASFIRANSESLSCSTNTAVDLSNIDCMVRCWVRLTSKTNTQTFINKGNTYFLYYHAGSDRFRWEVWADNTFGTGVTVAATTFGSPSLSTWYLLHGWHDSVNNIAGISVNAGTADTASYSSGIFTYTDAFYLGSDAYGNFIDGDLDDALIMKNAFLDATERTEDYNSGTGKAFSTWAGGGGGGPKGSLINRSRLLESVLHSSPLIA